MSNKGTINRGVPVDRRVPGQLTEFTEGTNISSPAVSLPLRYDRKPSNEIMVNLRLESDSGDPQFAGIFADNGIVRRQVGRVHNTNLAHREGLRYAMQEVKSNIWTKMGLKESVPVVFGDFTWRQNYLPKEVESIIAEAVEYAGLTLTGNFGPEGVARSRGPIQEYQWFNRPSYFEHDGETAAVPLDEEKSQNSSRMHTAVGTKSSGIKDAARMQTGGNLQPMNTGSTDHSTAFVSEIGRSISNSSNKLEEYLPYLIGEIGMPLYLGSTGKMSAVAVDINIPGALMAFNQVIRTGVSQKVVCQGAANKIAEKLTAAGIPAEPKAVKKVLMGLIKDPSSKKLASVLVKTDIKGHGSAGKFVARLVSDLAEKVATQVRRRN